MIDEFVTYFSAILGRSSRTCSEYAKELRQFGQWLGADDLTADDALAVATRGDVQRYISYCADAGNSAATRARKISSLRFFYNWALEMSVLTVNPVAGIYIGPTTASVTKIANRPVDAAGFLVVLAPNETGSYGVLQLFFPYNAGSIYSRQWNWGSTDWPAWRSNA